MRRKDTPKIRLLDEGCAPISDAKLYILQVGYDGKYPYKPMRKRIDKKLINTKSKSTFVGHGTATSDNLGNANFLTIYPPGKEQDFINVRIVHTHYGEFQTKIEITEDMVKKAKDHDVVETTITLPWENIRRSY